MLLSTQWLKEDYGIDLPPELLVERLTMAGLEVDDVTLAAPSFSGVIVSQVLTVNAHPDADKLRVATVNTGNSEVLQIVCGAPNIAAGIRVPLATIGAVLPGDVRIKKSKLRGIESFGMLCSARELGLSDEHAGLLILPEDAPIGADIRDYLHLNDSIIDIDLTPNRADCFSMLGLAREIVQLCRAELGGDFSLPPLSATEVATSGKCSLVIENRTPQDCPRYLGRIIRGIDVSRSTPPQIAERLRRVGIRPHDPVVDVTNYVMLMLGTPLHAFDADKISGGIVVRYAQAEEKLRLLNDSEALLDEDVLVIADKEKTLAIAGVMGGADSACSVSTCNIVLEAAWFSPLRIAGKARRFGLASDSAQRFERGVDYTLQEAALNLATNLILNICGGEAEAFGAAVSTEHLPQRLPVSVSREAIAQRIGCSYEDMTVNTILMGLGGEVQFADGIWEVEPPAWRFDLMISEDLIEEIARIDGYANIPDHLPIVQYRQDAGENHRSLRYYSDLLVAQGFQETVTYSFIDNASHQAFFPECPAITLQNPISANLAEMRLSLLPGLVNAVIYNRNRQQQDLRLFECGRVFLPLAGKSSANCVQLLRIAGVISGLALPEQWAVKEREADFFDAKAVVENLLVQKRGVNYRASQQTYLHPGKSADIYDCTGQYLGCMGALHPRLLQTLNVRGNDIYVFEINDFAVLPETYLPHYCSISKFPSVRRDLALVVDKDIAAADILAAIRKQVGENLNDVYCFDVYQGKSLGDKLSIAVALFLQNSEKTLQDEEVESTIDALVTHLKNIFSAELR